ncbi:mu-type opioid receptor-like [Convolutriloba macropyga]|uniref:mu-type opioid receptor-like n=1 Tax=Convolutriloba macropyga TaxID=536237 RepID=UPI003F51E7A4
MVHQPLAVLASCYNSVAYEVFEEENFGGLSCRISQSLPRWFWVLVVCWTLFGMLLAPLVFMLAVYMKICLYLHRMPANTKGKQSQTKVTRSCIILLTVFLLCWLPDQTYYFFYAIKPWGIQLRLDSIGYHLVVNLGFANSAFNPFLYAFLNPSYKEAFLKLFKSRRARLQRATTGIDTSINRSITQDDDNTNV